jgi:hypothetical protein
MSARPGKKRSEKVNDDGDGLPAEGPHDRGEERRGVMALIRKD